MGICMQAWYAKVTRRNRVGVRVRAGKYHICRQAPFALCLQVADIGDTLTPVENRDNSAFFIANDVENAVVAVGDFMDSEGCKRWNGREWIHRRERREQSGGFVEAGMPARRCFQVAILGDVSNMAAKSVYRMIGPVHCHNPNSFRIMSNTSSFERHSPLANCSSPMRRSSRTCSAILCSFSHLDMMGSQSVMLTSTDVGLPFCVTMMGRWVERVFSKYSPSLPRHSVKEIMSSDRIGLRGPGWSARPDAVRAVGRVVARAEDWFFVRMDSAPVSDAYIVQKNVQQVKWKRTGKCNGLVDFVDRRIRSDAAVH